MFTRLGKGVALLAHCSSDATRPLPTAPIPSPDGRTEAPARGDGEVLGAWSGQDGETGRNRPESTTVFASPAALQ